MPLNSTLFFAIFWFLSDLLTDKWLSENYAGYKPDELLHYLQFAFKVLKLRLSSMKSFNVNGTT